MADDKNKTPKSDDMPILNTNLNKKIIDDVQKSIDDLYKNTYFTNNDNTKYIDSIKRKMDND